MSPSPKYTYDNVGLCRCGCGKPTSNRSGYYKDCRIANCKKCQKDFRWSGVPETVCLSCRSKLGNSDVRHASNIGAIL